MPKISIITINYNNLKGLQRTVESVVNQTWQEFEYIVIDGGSTDGGSAYVESQNDKIDQWVSQPDNGIYNAMNKGIELATGEYLLFLNSGDYFYDNQILAKNIAHIDICDLIAFDIHLLSIDIDRIHRHPDKLLFSFLFEETFAHQSIFIKRELFERIGLYDDTLKIVADWKFFIHAVLSGCTYKSVHATLTTFIYGGISSSGDGPLVVRKERDFVLRNEFPLFYEDYKLLEKQKTMLAMNRFKMLIEIEKSKFGKKIVSFFFRAYVFLFAKKKIKEVLK